MNKAEERAHSGGSHASQSEIDNLLAELGYQRPPEPKERPAAQAPLPASARAQKPASAAPKPAPRAEARSERVLPAAEVPKAASARAQKSASAAPKPAPRAETRSERVAPAAEASKPRAADAPEAQVEIEVPLPREPRRTHGIKRAARKSRRKTQDTRRAAEPVFGMEDSDDNSPLLDIPLEVQRKTPRVPRVVPESRFVKLLRGALEENVDEMAVLTALPAPDGPTLTRGQRTKKRLYFCMGVLFFVAAIWGLFSLGSLAVGKMRSFASNESQTEALEEYLAPLVLMDITPFSSVDALDDEQIITAAIWDFIMYGDFAKYEQTLGVVTVPAVDVDVFAAKLFGSGLTINHQTVGAGDLRFYYSEDIKSYNIPTAPAFYSYMPRIERLEKDGATYTLDVAYALETPQWQQAAGGLESEKTARYVVEETEDGYCVRAVERIAGDASSDAQTNE